MKIQYIDFREEFFDVLDVEQNLEIVETGFVFIEGPIWDKQEQTLTFNDIPISRTYRYSEKTGLKILREFTNKGNGNAFDQEGNIIVCEHARSCLSRTDHEGKNLEILVSHYCGKELNSPNDVVVKSDGKIYFTDPIFGRNPTNVGIPRMSQLDVRGVYSYDPKNKVLKLLNADFENPNGLCFSNDERYLFVNDSPRKHIKRFKVNEDGTLEEGIIWAETKGNAVGLPDGMKMDQNENIYCCAQGGIHIFDKRGTCLGIVFVPEKMGNCAFGGKNMDILYIAASTTLYSFQIKGNAS